MEEENRVVVLIDMDCFYCQVEEKLDPELKGKPIAVVQYNPWKGGGIIAVNYVARAMGVTRHMRGDEAREKCPEIHLPSVPCQRGKADITKYRDAGKEVAKILQKFTPLLERASIDEAYLDITAAVEERLKTLSTVTTALIPSTYALGYNNIEELISDVDICGSDSIDFDYDHARRLLVGAVVVSEIRKAVFDETGYTCSAGIAHNKILAKLVCGMNKPNKQTILPKHSINILYSTLSVKKVKHLGGKFGDTVCEILKIKTMGDLQRFTEKELQSRFDEKNGTWLYNIARGTDLEPVQARFNPKSIGCCKQFRGRSALTQLAALRKWLQDLGDEIDGRLEKDALENNRTPKQMVVSFALQMTDGRDTSSSRSYNFVAEDDFCGDFFANKALELIMDSAEGVRVNDGESDRKLKAPIKFLGISVGKFEDNDKKVKRIVDYFAVGSASGAKTKDTNHKEANDTKNEPKSNKEGKEYILQKFFQVKESKSEVETNVDKDVAESVIKTNPIALQSTLSKQESFFAKFLQAGNKKSDDESTIDSGIKANGAINVGGRANTPVCQIVQCGEDSNDTEYSGSTINKEINESIALFEEDPQDVARVSNMRELLKSTMKVDEDTITDAADRNAIEENRTNHEEITNLPENNETYECTECNKVLPISVVATHSDYHLALKLREEERQRVRNENKQRNESKKLTVKEDFKRRKPEEPSKNETITSIASFLVKIDDNTPTEVCSDCGKRVVVDKFREHLDFHEAQKLSRELNKKSKPSFYNSNNEKRKRKSTSPAKQSKVPCNSRSIASFFR